MENVKNRNQVSDIGRLRDQDATDSLGWKVTKKQGREEKEKRIKKGRKKRDDQD